MQRFILFGGQYSYYSNNTMLRPYFLFSLLLYFTCLNKAEAQQLPPDTSIYLSAKDHLIQLYIDSAKENLRIYNGTEFTAAYKSSLGHPFFEYQDPQKGAIFYDGILYPEVRLLYDIIRDDVIFLNEYKNLNIKLIPQKINWFTLQDHLFVHLFEDSNAVNLPEKGFYELLYDGTISVFKKSKKTLYEASRADESSKFVESNDYFIRKNNTYYSINNKRSLLAVCRDRKADVAKFIQKEGLNFKKDPEKMIVMVIDYYTKIKK